MEIKEQSDASLEGLQEVFTFPLIKALLGRRTRRFGLGMSIPNGPFAYTSKREPLPLSLQERTLLVLCSAGVSGWNLGFEHTALGEPEKGCNYPIRLIGRTTPSVGGTGTSELIFTDDTGTYITQFRDLMPEQQQRIAEASDMKSLTSVVMENCVQLAPTRVDLPSRTPHVTSHNLWNVNKPGTTLFIPIIDLAQITLNALLIELLAGFTPFDPLHNRICGKLDRFIKSGLLNKTKSVSLVELERGMLIAAAIELAMMCQNIVLVMQAIGLGGWMFRGGINSDSIMGAFSEQGIRGLGIRFERNPSWTHPNPVGLDRYFEGLCPPYYQDMSLAVRHLVDLKFGSSGTFDPQRPGPFRENEQIKANVERYSMETVECASEVAQYIYDTYGKFPATIPSIGVMIYAQAQHLDTDFYNRFYSSDIYLDSHAHHMDRWH